MNINLLASMIVALPINNHEKTKKELAAIISESEQRPKNQTLRMAYLRGCAGRYKETNPALFNAIHDHIFQTLYQGFNKKETPIDQLDHMIGYLNRVSENLKKIAA